MVFMFAGVGDFFMGCVGMQVGRGTLFDAMYSMSEMCWVDGPMYSHLSSDFLLTTMRQ